jgi:outer membrane protein OmpA-like peptidoglycan-associated protein
MRKAGFLVVSFLGLFLASAEPLFALEDMKGGQDHPDIPRIDGSMIVGYAYEQYGEGEFVTEIRDSNLHTEAVEGELTRVVYVGTKALGSLGILRNYQKAFEDLGKVTEKFSCRKNCPGNLGKAFIWAKNRQFANTMENAGYKYGNSAFYIDQSYWYGTVLTDDAEYTISLYSAVRTDRDLYKGGQYESGQALIHLDVVKSAEFKATLGVVEPEEIFEALADTGHIALYGIYFDFDSATLKRESASALESITTAMNSNPSLNIYVVGHTDNQGTLAYNLDLSKRRAVSVVEALTGEHGITAERLRAGGVGPMAPLASNSTEEGQARNRRVELVAN